MIWLWSEYFRAIPHLEQSGVLKNFALETEGHFFRAVSGRGKTLLQSGPAGDSSGCTGGGTF